MWCCIAPVVYSTLIILRGAYRACKSPSLYWTMLMPISLVYASIFLIFSTAEADPCFHYEFWSIELVFILLTIKIIVCSVTKVT